MEILKKNLVSILCLVVALLAVGGTFYPLGGYFDQLKKDVDQTAANGNELKALEKKPRSVPGIGTNGASLPLNHYPTDAILTSMREMFQGALTTQAEKLEDELILINDRHNDLLVPNSLPDPTGPATFDFKGAYAQALDDLKVKVLNSCLPPTADEIKQRQDLLRTSLNLELIVISGKAQNQKDLDERYARESKLIPLQMRIHRAQEEGFKMYVMPSALAVTEPRISKPELRPTPDDIWFAQVGYWTAKDVCAAIQKTNEDSKDIPHSPVKALVSLNLPVSLELYVMPVSKDMNVLRDKASDPYLTAKPDAAHPPIYVLSPTGRACNSLYDVVQFSLTVYMDPQYVQIFARNLTKGRFLTVKEINLSPFEPGHESAGAGVESERSYMGTGTGVPTGYYYGENLKLVKVDMQCEVLMLRSWTHKLMPSTVKSALHVGEK